MGKRRRAAGLAAGLTALPTLFAALLIAAPVGIAAEAPDPPRNLPIGELPMACLEEASAAATLCENDVVYYLNRNRVAMGLGPYALPQDFPSLSADRQIFILSNLDRIAYGLLPITGLNSTLSAAALDGVHARDDPTAPPSLSSGPITQWAANWAGGFLNPPYAYNMWMYSDCPQDSHASCWGHRHNVLVELPLPHGNDVYLAMGAALGTDEHGEAGYAQLITESSGSAPDYYYTWADAQADGAGTYPYDPGIPMLGERKSPITPRLTLKPRRVGGHTVALRVGGSAVLRGRSATLTVLRERFACRGRPAACHWVRAGAKRTRKVILSKASEIPLPHLTTGERIAARIETSSFVVNRQRYRRATSSRFLR